LPACLFRAEAAAGDHVDLGVVIVLEDQVVSLIAELDTVSIERDQNGLPGPECRIDWPDSGVLVVDELHLLVYPLALGSGKRVLPNGLHATFSLKAATPYPSGVVGLHYVRQR
jgi:hypothetical protein